MAEPEPKRLCVDTTRIVNRLIDTIVDEFAKVQKLAEGDIMLRDLLAIAAKEYCADLARDEKTPLNLRETLDLAGLKDAVALEGESPDEMADSNMHMSGNSRINAILLRNNDDMMQCTRFHARPFENIWVVYGIK